MVTVLQASQLSLRDLQIKFQVQYVHQAPWFSEWQVEQPDLNEYERYTLDKAQTDFIYLDAYPVHEEIVKLVILAPILSVAGFYQPPFHPIAEQSIEIALEDEQEILRGRIDVLLLQGDLWIAVIESKQKRFNLREALPQALVYMMSNLQTNVPQFGLLTNGSEFQFLKLMRHTVPQYSLSRLFSLYNPNNELYSVIGILRSLSH
jgi:predicted type IV restriction endonuclease